MMIKFGESGHPVFRVTSPFSRGMLKSKGGGQFSLHFCADGDSIETVLRTIISVNQLFVPADLLIMTPTPSIEIPTQENLLQKQKQRVEELPQPDQLMKICTDAGFLKTVEIGQYFMTKHANNLQSQ